MSLGIGFYCSKLMSSRFTFAITTISMAKNDALFSYVAPSNIFAWALMPLRYFMSMKQYVWLNRAVIKVTHCPILFCIYVYERCFLAPDMYEATDLVDKPHPGRHQGFSDRVSRSAFFSPSIRVREESVVGYHKDRALEEVFRRAPEMRTQRRERRKTQTAIRTWMDQQYHSPQNYSTIDSRIGSDWQKRLSMNLERPSRVPRRYSEIRSTASDPADMISEAPYAMAAEMYDDGIARRDYAFEVKDNTDGDADGDDELVTNDEDEGDDVTNTMDEQGIPGEEAIEEDYFTTPVVTRFTNAELSADPPRPETSRRVPQHTRTLSTTTILYAPEEDMQPYSSSSASGWPTTRAFSRPLSTRQQTPIATPIARDTGRRSPRRSMYLVSRPRSMIQPSDLAPGRTGLTLDIPPLPTTSTKLPMRRRSLADLDDDNDTLSARSNSNSAADLQATKLMLAKMKSLEASLGDMVREMSESPSNPPMDTPPSKPTHSNRRTETNQKKKKRNPPPIHPQHSQQLRRRPLLGQTPPPPLPLPLPRSPPIPTPPPPPQLRPLLCRIRRSLRQPTPHRSRRRDDTRPRPERRRRRAGSGRDCHWRSGYAAEGCCCRCCYRY